MTDIKVKHNDAAKLKKPNTVMYVLTNNYPENSDILKKPVGKTHKCIYMLRGIKDKKNIKNQKKTKKPIEHKKIKKEYKKDKKIKKKTKTIKEKFSSILIGM